MGHFIFDDASRDRAAWNAGKKAGTMRPFTQKQIRAVHIFLDRERRIRNRALFDLASTASFAVVTWSRSGFAM